ncbi:hypothetical protein B0T24DRAFT_724305 [Lasiosphaeria ovina]|uniref:NmrA-like domain-containing protein n=1 Tax=Lasiosphaeria ovina TaxID=92902 RepID=A0AAE0JUP1_9PEZI|nr:hypothetical protein B0T24DRAFT_724305 [Lasiosphaeria ovina]
MANQLAHIKWVTVVGDTTPLGKAVVEALIPHPGYALRVLRPVSSEEPVAHPYMVVDRVPDDWDSEITMDALSASHAVVNCLDVTWENRWKHHRVAEAAFRGEVSRYIPATFGSVDCRNQQARRALKLYEEKYKLLKYVKDKALGPDNIIEHPDGSLTRPFSWTSIVTGLFLDRGIKDRSLSIDPALRRIGIFDGGYTYCSYSTVRLAAAAVLRVLDNPDKTKNKVVHVQSFCVSQDELKASLERVTHQRWTPVSMGLPVYTPFLMNLAQNDHFEATKILNHLVGVVEGDYATESGLDMSELGMPMQMEPLDYVVKKGLELEGN